MCVISFCWLLDLPYLVISNFLLSIAFRRRGYDGTIYSSTDKELFTFHDNDLLIPHLETLHPVPTASTDMYKVGQLFCDVRSLKVNPDEPYLMVPREVAQRQLDRLHQLGLELYSGYENEVTIENRQASPSEITLLSSMMMYSIRCLIVHILWVDLVCMANISEYPH